MANNFRLGGYKDANSVVPPNNQGLNKYASKRLDNTVARAIQRHENALKVDAIGMYLWRRTKAGLICTCRDPKKPLDRSEFKPDPTTPAQLRNPRDAEYASPADGGDDFGDDDFKLVNIRPKSSLETLWDLNTVPAELASLITTTPDFEQTDGVDDIADAPLDVQQLKSDHELALMLSSGGAMSGGDKTACGICLGTGRNHGYQLYTGNRIILDATNEWPTQLIGAADKDYNKYPTKFILTGNANNYVQWTVDLPAFVNQWLTFSIRDNTKATHGLVLEYFTNNAWQPITVNALAAGNGSDRRATKIRVRIADWANPAETYYFTHAEIVYENTKPIPVACEPLSYNVNFDVAQPLINTTFEVLASVGEIPRQSIFQDTKFKRLWQVTDVNPRTTASGQTFVISVNVRSVHESEVSNVLQTLFNPSVDFDFRGLEKYDGGVPSTARIDAAPDVMEFPTTDFSDYTPRRD